MVAAKHAVKNTDKSTNVEVAVAGDLSLDEMEPVLAETASDIGLQFSHITTLGAQRYPGNRHWHLKQNPRERGCLDVTYWPSGPLMWITIRHYEPAWVHEAGQLLALELEARFTRGESVV